MTLTRKQVGRLAPQANALDAFNVGAQSMVAVNDKLNYNGISYSPPDKGAYCDLIRGTIHIPYQNNMTVTKYIKLRGYAMHEMMHVKHTDKTVYMETAQTSNLHASAANMMEDYNINHTGIQGYKGYRQAMETTWREIIKDDLMDMRDNQNEQPLAIQILTQVHYQLQDLFRLGMQHDYFRLQEVRDKAQEFIDKHKTELDILRQADSNTQMAMSLACALVDYVKEQDQQYQDEQEGEGNEGEGESGDYTGSTDDGTGDSEDQRATSNEAQGAKPGVDRPSSYEAGSTGEGEGEDESTTGPDSVDSTADSGAGDDSNDGDEADGSVSGPSKSGKKGGSAGQCLPPWTGDTLPPVDPLQAAASNTDADQDDYYEYLTSERGICNTVVPLRITHGRIKEKDAELSARKELLSPLIKDIIKRTTAASSKLRTALMSRGRAQMRVNQEEGDLDEDKMPVICQGTAIDDPFTQQSNPTRAMNTAMSIVLDGSGSMQDTVECQQQETLEEQIRIVRGNSSEVHRRKNNMKEYLSVIASAGADMSIIHKAMEDACISKDDSISKISNTFGFVISDLDDFLCMLCGFSVPTLTEVTNAAAVGIHRMLCRIRTTHQISIFAPAHEGAGWTAMHRVLYPFGTRRMTPEQEDNVLYPGVGCGTPLAKSLKAELSMLLRRPEQRKVLLTMTDGGAEHPESAKAVITVARQLGVEVYGLGLGQAYILDCFPEDDPNVRCAMDPMEIPDSMAAIVREMALKKGR